MVLFIYPIINDLKSVLMVCLIFDANINHQWLQASGQILVPDGKMVFLGITTIPSLTE